MKTIRHVIRGCGYLKHCGDHPGTPFVIALILMGAVAGYKGGWTGALGGAAFMGVFVGPLYLWGAYDRSVLDEKINNKSPE